MLSISLYQHLGFVTTLLGVIVKVQRQKEMQAGTATNCNLQSELLFLPVIILASILSMPGSNTR